MAAASFITRVVTCQVAKEQAEIVEKQLAMQKNEKQPIFQIQERIIDYDEDGCDDTECISINIAKNEEMACE